MLRLSPALLAVLALLVAGCTGTPVATTSNDANCGTAGNAPCGDGSAGGNTTVRPTNATASGNASTAARPAPPVDLAVASTGIYPVNPAFNPATLTVARGAMVNLTFSNGDALPINTHNWVLEGVNGAGTDNIDPGASASVVFQAPSAAGDYVYFCSIGDHRDRGMVGTLTVQ